MIVKPIKTQRIEADSISLIDLLDKSLDSMPEKSVLAITSKIVSLCENNVVSPNDTDREVLINKESQYHLPKEQSKYGHHFTITNNTLIGAAGIDQSNSNDQYVLWPHDSWGTAKEIRQYLAKRFSLKEVGVVITDSTSTPLRLGTTGIALSYHGFKPLNDYIGKLDLFGKPFTVSRSNVAGGLASTAVLVMGEGTEQTPLVTLEDLSFVNFVDNDPTREDLESFSLSKEDDLFGPFLSAVEWLS
jgi:F420-0:gamma-glutamyl ligase